MHISIPSSHTHTRAASTSLHGLPNPGDDLRVSGVPFAASRLSCAVPGVQLLLWGDMSTKWGHRPISSCTSSKPTFNSALQPYKYPTLHVTGGYTSQTTQFSTPNASVTLYTAHIMYMFNLNSSALLSHHDFQITTTAACLGTMLKGLLTTLPFALQAPEAAFFWF